MSYSIRPFGGKNFQNNQRKCGPHEPCAICGKPIKNKDTAKWNEVFVTGKWEGKPEDSQGAFPVGPLSRRLTLVKAVRSSGPYRAASYRRSTGTPWTVNRR